MEATQGPVTATALPIEALLRQARAALEQCRFEAAAQGAALALGTAGTDDELASAGFLLCSAYHRLGRQQELVDIGDKVLEALDRNGRQRERCDVLRYLTITCGLIGQFTRALNYADECEHRAASLGPAQMTCAGSATAICYLLMGNPWQAERIICHIMQTCTEPSSPELIRARMVAWGNLGSAQSGIFDLLQSAGKIDEAADASRKALESFNQCLEIAQTLGAVSDIAISKSNIADVYLHLQEYASSATYLESAMALAATHGLGIIHLRCQSISGQLMLAEGKIDPAIALLEQVFESTDCGVDLKRDIHAGLHHAYVAKSDFQKALIHSEAARRLENMALTVQLQAQSAYMVTRLELERVSHQAQEAGDEAAAQRAVARSMEAAAHCDPLTGLGNRRMLDARLQSDIDIAHQRRRPISVVMVDLDHFKRVNDTHGHAAGDEVLRQVAQILRRSVRETDPVARVGGEEFVLVLADAGAAKAAALCERIRATVQGNDWNVVARGLKVTASLGSVTHPATAAPAAAPALLRLADEALYRSKSAGRNRVTMATP